MLWREVREWCVGLVVKGSEKEEASSRNGSVEVRERGVFNIYKQRGVCVTVCGE